MLTAGGSPYDLAVMHGGISHSAVYGMCLDGGGRNKPMLWIGLHISVFRTTSNVLLPVSLQKSRQQDLIAVLEQ